MFRIIFEFLKELNSRTLLNKDIHWNVIKTEKNNEMFYTIKSTFHNKEKHKLYAITLSTENNILIIDEINEGQKKYYLNDDGLISARNNLMNSVLYNNVSENEKEDIDTFNNILESKSCY